jgi:mannose-6-phosphate isomerase-like protein (cupin superfamily)
MTNHIATIENEKVRQWYEKNWDFNSFNQLVENYQEKGYTFNTKSGIIKKLMYDEQTTMDLGITVVSIAYPRPSSLHYHEDVGKAISITAGKGNYWEDCEGATVSIPLKSGVSVWVPRKRVHAFKPNKGEVLEMLITFDGIFDKKQEISLQPFDEFWNYKK